MENILKWLSWKKSIIATIVMTVTAYLSAKQYIWESEVVLIWWIVWAIMWTVSYQTKKIYNNNNN